MHPPHTPSRSRVPVIASVLPHLTLTGVSASASCPISPAAPACTCSEALALERSAAVQSRQTIHSNVRRRLSPALWGLKPRYRTTTSHHTHHAPCTMRRAPCTNTLRPHPPTREDVGGTLSVSRSLACVGHLAACTRSHLAPAPRPRKPVRAHLGLPDSPPQIHKLTMDDEQIAEFKSMQVVQAEHIKTTTLTTKDDKLAATKSKPATYAESCDAKSIAPPKRGIKAMTLPALARSIPAHSESTQCKHAAQCAPSVAAVYMQGSCACSVQRSTGHM